MNNTLGERIAEKRKEKKLTQEGLAEKLGILEKILKIILKQEILICVKNAF